MNKEYQKELCIERNKAVQLYKQRIQEGDMGSIIHIDNGHGHGHGTKSMREHKQKLSIERHGTIMHMYMYMHMIYIHALSTCT